ncbi:uncharacterized protein AMSG_07827 [Thecamonas trahens ATCC 50062]|uniref:Calcyclin-binding protein n=1 Tax=Thecamonas trahens ATCC 50062 TaxID=461836 RepID=A0A0L0DHQ5_THETB|nr:hypothetical protein AMSG_07827 [Thecamonas trahens ATCC 50062]KNC51755.1 hypothetical protein AMSG_07827 [Thecamonas trahens ATCC 50062]|eukprot:XP_013755883.1 hypothetical protein AMSG_07827 [Thecamonas trahens ATCC 50062]
MADQDVIEVNSLLESGLVTRERVRAVLEEARAAWEAEAARDAAGSRGGQEAASGAAEREAVILESGSLHFEKHYISQTDARMTVTFPLKEEVAVPAEEAVSAQFTPTSAAVTLRGYRGREFQYVVRQLCERIVPDESSAVLRTSRNGQQKLVVRLAKAERGVEWSGVSDEKKRKSEEHRALAESGATTMELIQSMYRNASDEDRASLAKAMAEGQRKREERARARA